MSKNKRSKKQKIIRSKQLMNVLCNNIAILLLEQNIFPGTKDFDYMFEKMIDAISDEIKVEVIHIIRKTIDS